jgi:hypothetical protein
LDAGRPVKRPAVMQADKSLGIGGVKEGTYMKVDSYYLTVCIYISSVWRNLIEGHIEMLT